MAGSLTDISHDKEAQERLVYEATHDVLTGVYNRRHIVTALRKTVHSARRYQYPVCVCMCDLDRFKHINDTYGHPVGDKVLASFGQLLRDELRAEDMPGRYGGDEFIVVFPHVAAQEAATAVERLRRMCRQMQVTGADGENVQTSATFGLADLAPEHEEPEDLVTTADDALYRAKDAGGNRVCIVGRGLMD
jgi:diguanylate cyclase (GGDEF)-like protein